MIPRRFINDTAWKHEILALKTARLYPRASVIPIGSLALWPAAVLFACYAMNAILPWAQENGWTGIFVLSTILCASLYLFAWLLVVALPRTLANSLYVVQLTISGHSTAVDARIGFLKSDERRNLI